MKYEYNGKTLNIPDDFIQNAMNNLSIDEDEAVQLWLEDNDYEVNERQIALDEKAKANVKVANIPDNARLNFSPICFFLLNIFLIYKIILQTTTYINSNN